MINELDVGDIVELEKGYIGIVCLSNAGLFTYVTTEDRFIISYFSLTVSRYFSSFQGINKNFLPNCLNSRGLSIISILFHLLNKDNEWTSFLPL